MALKFHMRCGLEYGIGLVVGIETRWMDRLLESCTVTYLHMSSEDNDDSHRPTDLYLCISMHEKKRVELK